MKNALLKNIFIAGALFLLVLFGFNGLYTEMLHGIIRENKERYGYIGMVIAEHVTGTMKSVAGRTFMLRDMVVQGGGDRSFFESLAPIIYRTARDDSGLVLLNLGLAPGYVVTDVYPLEGNEAFLGFDYSDVSMAGNAEALEAVDRGSIVVTEPFGLVQGGVGMAVRTPVFIESDGGREFWGIATATIEFDRLIENLSGGGLDGIKIKYRLRSLADGRIMAQSGEGFDGAVEVPFSMYNLSWCLDLMPAEGWYDFGMIMLGRGLVLFTSLIVMGLAISFTKIKGDSKVMRGMVERDMLTGCYSRYYINTELLARDGLSWRSQGCPYSVAIVDVDKFKSINDTYGHAAGDRVLVKIAEALLSCVDRKMGDRVARYGGDEFLVFMCGPDTVRMVDALGRMVSAVRSIKLDSCPGLSPSISVGGALNDASGGKSFTQLMKLADENLYHVKVNGRNGHKISQLGSL